MFKFDRVDEKYRLVSVKGTVTEVLESFSVVGLIIYRETGDVEHYGDAARLSRLFDGFLKAREAGDDDRDLALITSDSIPAAELNRMIDSPSYVLNWISVNHEAKEECLCQSRKI